MGDVPVSTLSFKLDRTRGDPDEKQAAALKLEWAVLDHLGRMASRTRSSTIKTDEFLILQQAFSGEWQGDRFFAVALRKKTHSEEPVEFQLSVYVSGPRASAERTEEFIKSVTEQHVRAEPGVEVWFQRDDASPSLPSPDFSYSGNFKVLKYEGKTYRLSSSRASKCFEIIYKAVAKGMDRVDGLTLRNELARAGHESPKAIRDIFNSPESKRVWRDLIDATPKGYYGLKI